MLVLHSRSDVTMSNSKLYVSITVDWEGEHFRDLGDLHATRAAIQTSLGARVPFTESWRLCGQCHGPKLRDWRVGIHGKRMGEWDGERSYLLCAHCHDPHAPRFAALPPEPPPVRPENIR